jgi:heavy metal translocating P-type ATPase
MALAEREIVLEIEGMTCASCVNRVEKALCEVGSVDAASVNLATRTATVRTNSEDITPLVEAVSRSGYVAAEHTGERANAAEVQDYAIRTAIAAALTVPILWLTFVAPHYAWSQDMVWALTTVVVFYSGWAFHRAAWRAARHGTTTMDTLISIGALAAYGYSAWANVQGQHEHYFDAAAVIVTLILLGKLLEARARREAGDASRSLLDRGAKDAVVLVDGEERLIPIDDVKPGMLAVVKPGQKIPTDGVVREGSSWVDLSLLTGESSPVSVGVGADVVGASINGDGRLVVFVTRVGANSRLAEIVRLLEHAQGSKAPIQRLADRVSAVFVPIVLGIAGITLIGWLWRDSSDVGAAIMHAVTVLIIACPCALGLATPAAIMAGTGRAAELGILFRGGEVFEAARTIDVALLDKTGTVTEGKMALVATHPASDSSESMLLSLAAAVEQGSEHPIARAVVDAASDRGLVLPEATGHRAEPGSGAVAIVDGAVINAGRVKGLPSDLTLVADEMASKGWTTVAVWRNGRPLGVLGVADTLKPEARSAVHRIAGYGIEVGLVTGDREETAEAIAQQVGIEHVSAEVFPEEKVDEVRRLQSEGRRVAFVGDGINDAPALAQADVGIAMGTGTDVALAAAQVSLMGGSLDAAADAIELARSTHRVIQQNLFWAFAYNVVMIPLAVLGILTPAMAAAAMALSSVSVVVNALRLRRFHRSWRVSLLQGSGRRVDRLNRSM